MVEILVVLITEIQAAQVVQVLEVMEQMETTLLQEMQEQVTDLISADQCFIMELVVQEEEIQVDPMVTGQQEIIHTEEEVQTMDKMDTLEEIVELLL